VATTRDARLSSPDGAPASGVNAPADWRTVWWFCVPALVIGFALRAALMAHMPFAFFISDTSEFITAPSDVFKMSARTPVGKILYVIPGLLKQPLLPWAALVQHLAGLGAVFAVGCLCRLWLTHWRWWIVPVTVLVAIHPSLLWYEHMCLPDSLYVALVLASAAVGGSYFRNPTRRTLIWFAVVLTITAATRQEGFLMLPFGILLVVSRHRHALRAHLGRVAVMAAVLLVAAATSKTTQGGQMLLTSTVHLAPDQLWFTPEFSSTARELRELFAAEWPAYPARHNPSRRLIVGRVKQFISETQGAKAAESDSRNNRLCKRVAMEIALRNWWRMPGIAYHKFLATLLERPAPTFGSDWAHEKHVAVFFGKPGEPPQKDASFMKAYLGREFASREEAEAELPKIYRVMNPDWLTAFQQWFYSVEFGWASPDRTVGPQTVPGLPVFYLIGFAGLVIAALRSRTWLSYRQLWLLFVLFAAFAIFATTSLRSRYRLIYEPWFLIGLGCLFDAAIVLVRGGWTAWRDADAIPGREIK